MFRNYSHTGYLNTNDLTKTEIHFYALNYDNIDYGLKVNGKQSKKYHTNIIYSVERMVFEKGKRVEIPTGMISAMFESGDGVGFEGQYGESMRVHQSTDVVFKFVVPNDIDVDRFKIDWSNSMPIYMKDQFNQANTAKSPLGSGNYKLYVYNNNTSDWERIGDVFEPKGGLKPYINKTNEIKVKAGITVDSNVNPGEYMWKPEIQLSGVVK